MSGFKEIHDWLRSLQKNPKGDPIYRLVWSDNLSEIRRGTFNDFYRDLFIRSVTETRETLKYNYIKERWILEKWIGPERLQNSELPKASLEGGYELLWLFEDKNRKYLPPTLKVVQFIIQFSETNIRMTKEERNTLIQKGEDKEIQAMVDSMDDHGELASLLHSREAIIKP